MAMKEPSIALLVEAARAGVPARRREILERGLEDSGHIFIYTGLFLGGNTVVDEKGKCRPIKPSFEMLERLAQIAIFGDKELRRSVNPRPGWAKDNGYLNMGVAPHGDDNLCELPKAQARQVRRWIKEGCNVLNWDEALLMKG